MPCSLLLIVAPLPSHDVTSEDRQTLVEFGLGDGHGVTSHVLHVSQQLCGEVLRNVGFQYCKCLLEYLSTFHWEMHPLSALSFSFWYAEVNYTGRASTYGRVNMKCCCVRSNTRATPTKSPTLILTVTT